MREPAIPAADQDPTRRFADNREIAPYPYPVANRLFHRESSGIFTREGCHWPPYRPAGGLSRSAQARRALLYPLVRTAACNEGIPVGLLDALVLQESRYNPFARSPVGAFGLGQLMPGTARDLGIDRYDLTANVAGAARYLRIQIATFGEPSLALAAYNAGPGRVHRAGGVPAIAETRDYVRAVLRGWHEFERRQRDLP